MAIQLILLYLILGCWTERPPPHLPPLDPNAPCPLHQHRGDGGLYHQDYNCYNYLLEQEGKHLDFPYILVGIVNGCYCDRGYVRRAFGDETCVPVEECEWPAQRWYEDELSYSSPRDQDSDL